ncbi:MAG: GNAT family N-acetyltransferase [Actinobacteria bacterium]|nr:GNAT family N-acetyltransferase [Actinomycetota bacterium]
MIEIESFTTPSPKSAFFAELRDLLFTSFESNFTEEDWEHGLGGTHICLRKSGKLISHAAVMPRRLYIEDQVVNSAYLENVATRPDHQHQGFGSKLLQVSSDLIFNQFELGALSSSKKALYRNFGWQDWKGPSFVIHDGHWIRSASEDCGIMVLKTRADISWNSSSRIACEDRSGDAW